MYKLLRFLFLGFLALLSVVAPAQADSADGLSFQIEAGYRMDELDWNIDGGAAGPNIISELEWDNLEIYQVRGTGELISTVEAAPFAILLKGSMTYGWIVDGENQDSDFAGDNRTLEYSRSNNSSDDGYVFDLSAGIGPRFTVLDEKLILTPLAGLSYHGQNLRMTEGNQTLSRPDIDPFVPPTGPFSGLDSTYETRWFGPWAGIDIELPLNRFSLYGSFEYHWVDFEADADWNLRNTLAHPKSFEHEAHGDGIILALGGNYHLTDRWSVHLNLDYREWKAENGEIRFFYAEGGGSTQGLNEVNWESWAAMFGVTYRFL